MVVLLTLWLAPAALAGEQTRVFTTPPITLKPYEVQQKPLLVKSPEVDGYVVGLVADVIDEQGNVEPTSNIMLHHIVFAKLGVPDYTCGRINGLAAERFYAEGEERAVMALPPGYGYANRGGDQWALLYMLMNHRNVTDTVRIQYRVRYVTDEQLTAVKPLWLDVRNCGTSEFDVPGTGPSGSTHTVSWNYRLPESGRIVGGGAHLHGGGIRLDLQNATCGTTLFSSAPTWKGMVVKPIMHEPGPSKMSQFRAAPGIPVAAGQTLRLQAVYENSTPHPRAMGIMMVFLAPEPVAACEATPALEVDLGEPSAPPRFVMPLLKQPRGPAQRVTRTWVGDFLFGAQQVSLKRGSTFTWRFVGREPHDVTVAAGPVGFSSPPWQNQGDTFSWRFNRKGTYKLYCSLHATRMTQLVRVR